MGTLFVLVSPCFRENIIVTCKIGFFCVWVCVWGCVCVCVCSLDNLLQKNAIVFFFGNQISKCRSFKKKKSYLWPTFHIFIHQGKITKIPSAHISLTYMYFAHPIDFFALPILKKNTNWSGWFLFGMSPGVDSYTRHFATINK